MSPFLFFQILILEESVPKKKRLNVCQVLFCFVLLPLRLNVPQVKAGCELSVKEKCASKA